MAQLSGRNSLHDIVDNISAQAQRLYHLGSAKLSRSCLSLINEDKPYALYKALFGKRLSRCQKVAPGHDFRFDDLLYSLDASTIDLCLSAFPWADIRTTKDAIKLHVGLNNLGYLPEFVTITGGKTRDIVVGRTLESPKGSMVAIDRGYSYYAWYSQLTEKEIYFITRLKFNAKTHVVSCRLVLSSKGLTSDQAIELTGIQTAKKCLIQLHRIGYRDSETGKHHIFLTNYFKQAAKTTTDIYKARWQVDLFFNWIKQNLKIKSFVGANKNAVMTQIWIARCVYRLLAFLKFQSKLKKSKQQIFRLLQLNLFERSDLMAFL